MGRSREGYAHLDHSLILSPTSEMFRTTDSSLIKLGVEIIPSDTRGTIPKLRQPCDCQQMKLTAGNWWRCRFLWAGRPPTLLRSRAGNCPRPHIPAVDLIASTKDLGAISPARWVSRLAWLGSPQNSRHRQRNAWMFLALKLQIVEENFLSKDTPAQDLTADQGFMNHDDQAPLLSDRDVK